MSAVLRAMRGVDAMSGGCDRSDRPDPDMMTPTQAAAVARAQRARLDEGRARDALAAATKTRQEAEAALLVAFLGSAS